MGLDSDHVMQKPFDFETLGDRLRRYCNGE
jgi:hypothetical protein